jgi:hypothetical protein
MNENDVTHDLPAASLSGDRTIRLEDIILQCLKAADEGRKPDRRQLVEQHPDLANELRYFYSEQDPVEEEFGPGRVPAPRSAAPTLPERVGH